MAINNRKIIPNAIGQGQHEEIAYKVDFTKWCRNGNPPSLPNVTLIRRDTGVDVTATNCSGAASVNGFVVTTPSVIDLLPNIMYRINVSCTIDGNIVEAWATITGEE